MFYRAFTIQTKEERFKAIVDRHGVVILHHNCEDFRRARKKKPEEREAKKEARPMSELSCQNMHCGNAMNQNNFFDFSARKESRVAPTMFKSDY